MISVHLQGKPFSITVIQVYAPTSNAEEAEVEQFYEDLQDLELTHKKDVLFIIGDWNAKVGSHEIPEVIRKFGLGVQNKAGQRLTEFCQENALVIASTLFQCWSGLRFPSPGDLPDPGIEPRSPALQADALPSEPPGKPNPILYSTLLKKLLFSSKSCLTLCEPMYCSTPGFAVLHCLLEFAQSHAY